MLEPKEAKKTVKYMLIALLIVFLSVTAVYSLKIANGEACGYDRISYYNNGAIQVADQLDTNNARALQHVPAHIHEEKHEEIYFCFGANATEGVEINIITLDETIASVAITEDYRFQCFNLGNVDNLSMNYLGLECPSCSAANPKVTLYEETLGEEVERIFESPSLTITDEKTFNWIIRPHNSCYKSIKQWLLWFFTGAVMLLLLLGTVYGYKKSKEVILSD